MTSDKTPIQIAVDALNSAFQADPEAIRRLFATYTTCNKKLGDHPTVQVSHVPDIGEETYLVSPIGILNGVIEPMTGGRVAYTHEKLDGGIWLTGFVVYNPKQRADGTVAP